MSVAPADYMLCSTICHVWGWESLTLLGWRIVPCSSNQNEAACWMSLTGGGDAGTFFKTGLCATQGYIILSV